MGARVRQIRLAEVHAAQDAHRMGEGVQDGPLGEGAGRGRRGGGRLRTLPGGHPLPGVLARGLPG